MKLPLANRGSEATTQELARAPPSSSYFFILGTSVRCSCGMIYNMSRADILGSVHHARHIAFSRSCSMATTAALRL